METFQRIQNIFRDVFDNNDLIISNNTSSNDIEDWDSLAHINLIVAIEKEFNIRFSLGDLEDLKNVGEMIIVLEKKVA